MSAYQALYRKWRPMTFDDVVGQKQASDTLKSSIEGGRVAHAYLFCGTRGTGKTSTAKIFSRAVNCENPHNGEPCNECETCRGILNGSILDVYEMDAASNRGVENIREIREEVIYTPVGCKYKVYIIDEVHMLTDEAFNALLKTLEEPPAHAIFILATTEPHQIPQTVLSRCQRFDFRRIGIDDIARRINKITEAEGIAITPDAAELIAELGDGSMRDAISILDRCAAFGGELTCDRISEITGIVVGKQLFEIADAVAEDNAKVALCRADEILKTGKEAQNLIENLIEHFRGLLVCKATDAPAALLEKTEQAAVKYSEQAEKFSVERLLYSIKSLGEYLAQAKRMSNPRIAVEMAMIKLCNLSYSNDMDALLARIEKLESKLAGISAGTVAVPTQPTAVSEIKETKAEKTEQNLPPWDIDESEVKKPEPVSAAEVREEPTQMVQEERTTDTSGGSDWEYWREALEEIKGKSKSLFGFLYNADAKISSGTVEIEVGSQFVYDRIATPGGIDYLSELFSRVGGQPLKAKIFIKGERREEKAEQNGFSIKDLAAKKDMLGDKMDIIN